MIYNQHLNLKLNVYIRQHVVQSILDSKLLLSILLLSIYIIYKNMTILHNESKKNRDGNVVLPQK